MFLFFTLVFWFFFLIWFSPFSFSFNCVIKFNRTKIRFKLKFVLKFLIYLEVICKVYHLKLNDNGKLSSALETEINRVLNKSSPASHQWMEELKRIKSELEVLLKEEKDKEAEENSDSDWVKANVQKKIQFFHFHIVAFVLCFYFLLWFSDFFFWFDFLHYYSVSIVSWVTTLVCRFTKLQALIFLTLSLSTQLQLNLIWIRLLLKITM